MRSERYYRRDGTSSTDTGIFRLITAREKYVAKTEVGWFKPDRVMVSTVLLVLDHQWGDGPPIIFETMVFGGRWDQEMDRYSTEAQALAGHWAMVHRVSYRGLLRTFDVTEREIAEAEKR